MGVLWWAGEAGVWASSGGGRGPLVCLGAPNESVIHGTRGSHRDRIRGALSNRSPERVKRYLICPPCSQLPLCTVCVLVGVCVCVSMNVSEGCWLGGGGSIPPTTTNSTLPNPKETFSPAAKMINYIPFIFFLPFDVDLDVISSLAKMK